MVMVSILARTLFASFLLISLWLSGCTTPASERPLFRYKDHDLAIKDLPPERQREIYNIRKEYYDSMREQVLDIVLARYFADIAKKRGQSVEAVKKSLIGRVKPSEYEKRMFYEQNKSTIIYPYKAAQAEIEKILEDKNRKRRREDLIPAIQKEADVFVYLEKPEPPKLVINNAAYPRKGPDDAKVTLVQFADLTCPLCRLADPEISRILKDHEGDVTYVYAFFPLEDHGEQAVDLARGGHCANQQDKFWPFLQHVYAKQYTLGKKTAVDIAKTLKFDTQAFTTCMQSKETAAFIERSHKQGVLAGVAGTPTFFVNGKRVATGFNFKNVRTAIEAAL